MQAQAKHTNQQQLLQSLPNWEYRHQHHCSTAGVAWPEAGRSWLSLLPTKNQTLVNTKRVAMKLGHTFMESIMSILR